MFILIDYLLIGEGCLCLWVPVDHTHATVDVTFIIQVAEHLDDAPAAGLVHGESRTVPVAGTTQAAQLFEDNATVLACPVPCVLKELLTGEVGLLDAFLCQFVHDLRLSRNAGVVSARHPAGILALHAGTPDQNVLNRIVQHMSHVEHPCNVGRWNHHGIRLTAIRLRTEKLVVQPVLVPFRFHNLWIILAC